MKNEEAEFLHDISAPLSGAILVLEARLEAQTNDQDARVAIEEALQSLVKVAELVRARANSIRT